MPATQVLHNIHEWLREHSPHLIREPGFPPRYSRKAPRARADDYQRRASTLVHQHRNIPQWFFGNKSQSNALVADITALAQGQALPHPRREQARDVLDELRLGMVFADFLVDAAGLRHASGASSCSTWHMSSAEDGDGYGERTAREIRRLRDELVIAIPRWTVVAARPQLPFLYVAACIYETDPARRRRKAILDRVVLLDRRFRLVREHFGYRSPDNFLVPRPAGTLSGMERFRLLLSEAKSRTCWDFERKTVPTVAEVFLKQARWSDESVDRL
ncbi:hypothetical protein SLS62_000656 [Diatrype stigma]|uniref:Uncharacterized protein n=1 Tax=Diatrype stigma TaxID=117547 RepID=A0AAN9V9P5_9PEZI